MRSVVNHVIDGIITIDESGTVTTFNPAAERIFGLLADEVIGQNVRMLMPEPYHREHDRYISNYRATGVAKIIGTGREVTGQRKNLSTFPMELAISESASAPTATSPGSSVTLPRGNALKRSCDRPRSACVRWSTTLSTALSVSTSGA